RRVSGSVMWRPPTASIAATSRPPALATSDCHPAAAIAWAISTVPRSTPPVTSEGTTWSTVIRAASAICAVTGFQLERAEQPGIIAQRARYKRCWQLARPPVGSGLRAASGIAPLDRPALAAKPPRLASPTPLADRPSGTLGRGGYACQLPAELR